MDPKKLKHWKERQLSDAESLVGSIADPSPPDIVKLYPEFHLKGVYTTSIDPYVPLGVLLPFFGTIIVGITPFFRTEGEFRDWYGIGVRQMLRLHERGRLNIRVLFPATSSSVPRFLNPFFSSDFPSTARDLLFDQRLLGQELFKKLQQQFIEIVAGFQHKRSIDGFKNHRSRAFKTAQTAYVQLYALGHPEYAHLFEIMWKQDERRALQWLEFCRLFLIGPVHYSLMGIHCVASNVPLLSHRIEKQYLQFPVELGRILVNALRLVRFGSARDSLTLQECLDVFPEFELARRTLLELDSALKTGSEKCEVKSADDLRNMIFAARSKKKKWLRLIRLAAATGIGAATIPFDVAIGLLAGLGFGISTEFASERVEKIISPLASKLQRRLPQHLTLLIDLDDSVRRYFREE